MTHEQYLDEPRETIAWGLAMAGMESDLEREQMEREQRKHAR